MAAQNRVLGGLGFKVWGAQDLGLRARLLEGSWDLVTTYNWAYNPTTKWPYRGYPNYK